MTSNNTMKKKEYGNMSNNEIKLEMRNLENSYEALKIKALKIINEMHDLDSEYIAAKNELINRSKGILWQKVM